MVDLGFARFGLDLPAFVTGVLVVIGCLAFAPFVVGHWRGTVRRIEEGTEHLPLSPASRRKLDATLPIAVLGLASVTVGTLADVMRPAVPVLPTAAFLLFAVCFVLWPMVWLWGRPRRLVPPRYRVGDWRSDQRTAAGEDTGDGRGR